MGYADPCKILYRIRCQQPERLSVFKCCFLAGYKNTHSPFGGRVDNPRANGDLRAQRRMRLASLARDYGDAIRQVVATVPLGIFGITVKIMTTGIRRRLQGSRCALDSFVDWGDPTSRSRTVSACGAIKAE